MSLEEAETHILYDYEENTVKVFTTRKGVYDKCLRRLKKSVISHGENPDGSYDITFPIEYARDPSAITRVLKKHIPYEE